MTGALFVISEQADRKLVNRVLLHLRHMEDCSGGDTDFYSVITSQGPLKRKTLPDTPPLQSFDNEWAGKSIRDTEQFMIEQYAIAQQRREDDSRAAERNDDIIPNPLFYLILDDQGVQEKTIILTGRDVDYDEARESFTHPPTFKKTRLPWERTSLNWINLDIGNMSYDEAFDDSNAAENDGWCVPQVPHEDNGPEREATNMREAAEASRKIETAIAQLESTGDA